MLVLVTRAGHSGCREVTLSHGTRDIAFGWTHGGHGSGREEGEMVGLEVGLEPISCCECPCSGHEAVG